MRNRTGRIGVVALVLTLLVMLVPLSPASAEATIVLVDPPSQSVDVGQTVSVNIKVDTVTDLYGVDIRLTFDAAKLEAQDAIDTMAGIQISQGDFLDPAQGFMAQNIADNTTGEVRYVFALMAPASAVSGTGVLARITFRAKAEGTAAISLTSVTLSNNQAEPIAATLMNGSITVLPAAGPTPTPTTPWLPVRGAVGRYRLLHRPAVWGSAAGHHPGQPADQSEPHSRGSGADHSHAAATAAGTCNVCGATGRQPVPHLPQVWGAC